MAEKYDFLSLLKRKEKSYYNATETRRNPRNLLIQLATESDIPFIRLVDNNGNPQRASEFAPQGTPGALIRKLTEIESNSVVGFNWGAIEADCSYSLQDYPFLTSFLETCKDRLVDSSMRPLTFISERKPVSFEIGEYGDDDYIARFMIDGIPVRKFISPTLAIAKNSIISINDIGERYADLSELLSPFGRNMLEIFLSIFFSVCQNVKVKLSGHKVSFIDEPVQLIPILVIEKIDTDNSLIVRITESAGDFAPELFENFDITSVALVTDYDIIVRRLSESTIDFSRQLLKEGIESAVGKRTAKTVWVDNNTYIIPEDVASKFLFSSFGNLINTFRIVGADKLKTYRIVAAKPKLQLKLASGIDFLEGKAHVEIGEQKFTLRDLLEQYSRNKYVTLSDGNRAVIDPAYIKRLQRIFNDPKKGENVKISFFDLPEVMEMLDDKAKAAPSFKEYRNFYEGFNSLNTKKLSLPNLKADLRDYQKEGVKWINYLYEKGMGGCLADDMGLGKTVQTIAMLTRSIPKAEKPSLIIMPRSLLFNWQEEFRKFAPKIKIATHYGSNRDLENSLKAEVILTSYAMIRNDIEEFLKHEFDYIILDESQNIKNVEAQVTQAVWLLKGKHRLAISGTPIENNLSELYSLFHFLNPAMFGSLKNFSEEYIAPIQRDADDDAARALRRKIFPFLLRRLKRDVLTDLPDRTEQILTVEMSPKQAKLYEERRQYFAGEIGNIVRQSGANKATFELLQALLELRQIASIPEEKSNGTIQSPKIELLMENLLPAVNNGHKVVVFFNFLAGIEITATKLENAGIGYEIMTGASRDRKKIVERFQNDEDCMVMLMTMKTGGVGLNLIAADTVFIMEPWWNKAAEEQAINRLHRIGQKNSVNCYYLITADTIEEKIRQLQEQKSALVDAVISSDTSGGKNLSADDINFLLS